MDKQELWEALNDPIMPESTPMFCGNCEHNCLNQTSQSCIVCKENHRMSNSFASSHFTNYASANGSKWKWDKGIKNG